MGWSGVEGVAKCGAVRNGLSSHTFLVARSRCSLPVPGVVDARMQNETSEAKRFLGDRGWEARGGVIEFEVARPYLHNIHAVAQIDLV